MKKIRINETDYILYSAGEASDGNIYPHMVNTLTGTVPAGSQMRLLKAYLHANGITPIDKANTHWCINAALKLTTPVSENIEVAVPHKPARQERKQKKPSASFPSAEPLYLPITAENIEEQNQLVQNSNNYGKENRIIHNILNAFPENTNLNTVAMKVAVIDVTNSTHLSQYKSELSLYDIAELIVGIKDFDERVKSGDPELVSIIARNNGVRNLFSFASKYCTYHNVEIYCRDDYSIYDSVVKEMLPHYVSDLTKYKVDTWRTSLDYVSFNACIGDLLDEYGIHIPFRRRKFDHFLWYANR